jgi:Polysaccharide lyase
MNVVEIYAMQIVRSITAVILASTVLIAHAQSATVPSSGINVYDGFETPTLSSLWETNRFKAGAVVMQSQIVRVGHGAAQITLQSHDTFQKGINGDLDTERDELMEDNELMSQEGAAYEFSFSMFLPANFPVVPTRLVIAQWKQYCAEQKDPCSGDSPVLAIRYIGGELLVTQAINKKRITLFERRGEFRNRWLDFRFRVKFSPSAAGRVQAWLGDEQIVNFSGVTADDDSTVTGYPSPSQFYFKMGLYRDLMAEPMTIYIDEYRKRQLKDGDL